MSAPVNIPELPEDDAVLREIAAMDLALARRLYGEAMAEADAEKAADITRAYNRVTRSLRQSIALRARLAQGWENHHVNHGRRVDLTAEMEYFAPEDRISWQRLLFYGRGGFDAINPRHFPYRQPDFRDPEVIRQTGNHPMPFVILVRRMGRERQATLPIDEARAVMNLLYDDFESHCAPEFLENSLDLVLDRLETRAKRKDFVELFPLPTGPKDLHRLKRLWRYNAYTRYYPNDAATREYLESGIREQLATEPKWLDHQLARIRSDLEARPAHVYGNRDKDLTWEGLPIVSRVEKPRAPRRTPEVAEAGK